PLFLDGEEGPVRAGRVRGRDRERHAGSARVSTDDDAGRRARRACDGPDGGGGHARRADARAGRNPRPADPADPGRGAEHADPARAAPDRRGRRPHAAAGGRRVGESRDRRVRRVARGAAARDAGARPAQALAPSPGAGPARDRGRALPAIPAATPASIIAISDNLPPGMGSGTDSRASAGGAPAPRRPAARSARTMFEKIWARHVVAEGPGGHVLLYIDRHLLHEGTTAAFGRLA